MKENLSKTSESSPIVPEGYKALLEDLKIRIRSAQVKAIVKVNEELLKLYWEIGREITERQEKQGWGTQVIERLAKDLQNSLPGVGGFSRTNIFRMRAFYLTYQKVPQAVKDYYLDLLFYHIALRCFVIIELKNTGDGVIIDKSFEPGTSPYFEEAFRVLSTSQLVRDRLGDKFSDKMLSFILENKDFFPRVDGNICLTHSDFKPVNLLYRNSKVFVLDWEFAHAGIGILDFAILLRPELLPKPRLRLIWARQIQLKRRRQGYSLA